MIAEARKRAEGFNLPVESSVGDVHHLHFADNTFDGCRAERVFIHVENPRQALIEMTRVTRSGGRIVVLEPDFETLIIDAEDRALTRKLLNFNCDRKPRNGWIGRQLPRLFHEAQLIDIHINTAVYTLTDYAVAMQLIRLPETVELAQTVGVVSASEAALWLGALEKADQEGYFFCCFDVLFRQWA
jgi:SAM-dependent methyltransferase